MKSFFDSDYQNDSFDQNDQKNLQNTDHTTGNQFDQIDNNPFNASLKLIFNQNSQRMIHCVNQNSQIYEQFEAQDIDFPQQFNSNQFKLNHQSEQVKSETSVQIEPIITQNNENQTYQRSHFIVPLKNKKLLQPTKKPEIKLSKKWDKKISSILQEKKIHQQSAKHNRNMAKFFIRLFAKYYKSRDKKGNFSDETQEKLKQILQKKCVSLKDLQILFGGQCSRTNRQFFSRVLRNCLKQQVIYSQDVQNKQAYLFCSKVYALRCRSRLLVGRLQSR